MSLKHENHETKVFQIVSCTFHSVYPSSYVTTSLGWAENGAWGGWGGGWVVGVVVDGGGGGGA